MRLLHWLIGSAMLVLAVSCGQASSPPPSQTPLPTAPQCEADASEKGPPANFTDVGGFSLDPKGKVSAVSGKDATRSDASDTKTITVSWPGGVRLEVTPTIRNTATINNTGKPVVLYYAHPDNRALLCYTKVIPKDETFRATRDRTYNVYAGS